MMLRFPRPIDSHEAWFGQHYADLLRWAIRFTSGDQDAADELVHDLFVHVLASRPDLSAIENPKGYFYTALRNLHLSNARRQARHPEIGVGSGEFDVLEYASLRASLHYVVHERAAVDLRDQFQHQLRAVWRYAQLRKSSSKAASVLLLRFFHGYYPEEIALILRTSREAIDQLLRQARKEVRLYLADPDEDETPEDGSSVATGWPADGLLSPPDLARTLHQAALQSDPEGTCLDEAAIVALYPLTDDRPRVPTAKLAHIVSCCGCLTNVTRRLDLPPLAGRHPLDSLGYDRDTTPPRGSTGGGGAASGGGRRSARARQQIDAGRRRLADLLAHAPKELRIAVNGVILGGQQITSAVSRQTLRLTTPTADFVEVFSERDVRMLFISLEAPPQGPVEVHQTVALNEGRRLEAHVSFAGASPVVHVSYFDPAPADAPVVAPAPTAPRSRRAPGQRLGDWISRLPWPHLRPSHWRPSRRGAFTTVVIATTIAAVLLNQLGRPVLSAAELLQKSSAADAEWRTDTAHAVHRTLDLEARSRDTGTTTRRRIDVWQSASRGITVRRLYDERNQLLAGEWIDSGGARAVHRTAGTAADEPQAGGMDAWRLAPSAADFLRLIGTVDTATVTRERNWFRISFEPTGSAEGPALLSASLTIREDWRAVEQRATVRTAEGTTDITWTERTRETSPSAGVPASVFEVNPNLVAPAPAPSVAPAVVPRGATAGLEIAALAALRRIDADLGEEVRVRRVDGRLHITGVVASTERRAQVQSVLEPISRDPAARVHIDTVDEVHARARRGQAAPVPLEPGNGDQAPILGPQQVPAHEVVRAYLLGTGVREALADHEVARVANRVVQQATRMRVHAWALRALLDQVSAADATTLDADARQQWRALVAEHGRAFVAEAGSLRTLVAPFYTDGAPADPTVVPGASLDRDDQIREASQRFVTRAADVDAQIVAAFTLRATGTTPPALDARRFWATFTQAVTLAATLDRSVEALASQRR